MDNNCNISVSHSFKLTALAIAMSAVAGTSYAQQEGSETAETASAQLEVISVTARKRTESIMEVPESVTAMSESMMEKAGIDGLADIGLQVPNLYMSTRLDGFPNVSIRGLGGFGNTQGVGFYLDDVQLFSDASSRFGDLQRIEVLKGPQGILYGGSNIGGAIKFISKRPSTDDFESRVKATLGTDSFSDLEAEFNIPLSEDWAMRFFAYTETDDSYFTNPNSPRQSGVSGTNAKDVGKKDQSGIRLALGGTSGDLSIYASVRYNELNGANNIWSRETSDDFQYSNSVDTSFNPQIEKDTLAGSIELEYEFENMTFTSITAYSDSEMVRESDLDISPELILDLVRPEDVTTFSQELRLSSSSVGPLEWQVGVYHLNLERELASELIVYEGFCFLDPGFCDPSPGSEILAVDPFEVSDRTRKQSALFANVNYSWDSFEAGFGIRLDEWESTRINKISSLSGELSDTEVLGRFSLSWTQEDGGMFYGTISQGFEPGDLNLNNFTGDNTLIPYGNESAIQYEIGYKNRMLDNRLDIYAAIFAIDYSDRQYELQATDPNGGFVEGIINAGDSSQWGFESDFTFALTENWIVSGGIGYVDAEWKDGTVLAGINADLSGKTPPNISNFSSSLALEYYESLTDELEFSARLGMQYKGASSTNSQFFPGGVIGEFENPSFTVFNLNTTFEWEHLKVSLMLENLTDEEYYVDVQEFPNFAGSALPGAAEGVIIGTLEQPRRVRLSIQYTF
tara:strand:- start:2728 stop:4950 length:2223 start_codon:yes stop_codon:yes gene_type:complete